MKRQIIDGLSKIINYPRLKSILASIAHTSNFFGLYEFDIFNKIPDESCILAYNHSFKAFGKVADQYLLGVASPRKIRYIYYHELEKNELYKTFLEKLGAISNKKVWKLNGFLCDNECIGIAPEGPAHKPSKKGYIGVAWLAKKYQLPILPVKITTEQGRVKIKTGNKINIPTDATKSQLKDITELIIKEFE